MTVATAKLAPERRGGVQLDLFDRPPPERDLWRDLGAAVRAHVARLRIEDPTNHLVLICDQADALDRAQQESARRGVERRLEVAGLVAPFILTELDRRAPAALKRGERHQRIYLGRGIGDPTEHYWSGKLESEQRQPGALAEQVAKWAEFAARIEMLRERLRAVGPDVLARFDANDKPRELPEDRLGYWRGAWEETTPIVIVAKFNPHWIYHGWHLYAREERTGRNENGDWGWIRCENGARAVRDFCEFLGHQRMPRVKERDQCAFVEEFARRFRQGLPARSGRWHRYHLPDCFRTASEEPEGSCKCGATVWYESRFEEWQPLEPVPGWDRDERPAPPPSTKGRKKPAVPVEECDGDEAAVDHDDDTEDEDAVPSPARNRRRAVVDRSTGTDA